MVNEVEGIERIRFMTSHPKDLSDELIQAMADCDKVCKYLHLPVQSGSDEILRRMNRHYTKESYMELVRKARAAMPDITLSTDIIVGFPGGGFPRNLGCHPQIPLQHRVYLYLFQADRHPCGNYGKSGAGGCH